MIEREREELERDIQSRRDAGDLDGAVTIAVRGYGSEILRFLVVLHRDDSEASEVFSLFLEGLWRGLAGFAWECSFRTWAYAVARRASLRYRRDEGRRAAKVAPLPEGSALSAIAQEVRSRTLSFLATERRNRLVELRDALPPEDRALLVLRVDRRLAWNDLARALHDDETTPLSAEDLKREAARLRKRFQLVKERLLEHGRREGLIRDP
jgi:RNA polymerase sigma-70 factor (ECF subfamily)